MFGQVTNSTVAILNGLGTTGSPRMLCTNFTALLHICHHVVRESRYVSQQQYLHVVLHSLLFMEETDSIPRVILLFT